MDTARKHLLQARVVACGLLLLVATGTPAQSQESLVTVETGELPIILSAPHGGGEAIPGVAVRQGLNVDLFKTKSDAFTGQLAEKLADAMESEFGKRPYVVIARFHRKYLDANRPKRLAYESEEAESTYDAYHQALAAARDEVSERWGRGILLDIHGQAAEPLAIFRGTQNGKTTNHLVRRFGRETLIGETSLFGQLAKQGLHVIPAVGASDDEHPSYDGGYIVNTYGSRQSGTVDAIQLELGRQLRSPSVHAETAGKLASAIAAFAKDYLPSEEQVTATDGKNQSEENGKRTVFSDDFADGDRGGWFEIDRDSSALTVNPESGQLSSLPELNFAASDPATLKSVVTHFSQVKLQKAGDQVSVRFDARHNNEGWVDRGFRFGLFDSKGTKIERDGNHDLSTASLDDDGYFVMVDLGSRTTSTSAIIRETNNAKDQRLWNGKTVAYDDNDGAADPLMFTRNRGCTYTFTLTRNSEDAIDILLTNNVSGDSGGLTGITSLTPTLTLDSLYFGTFGSTADFAIDNVVVSTGHQIPTTSANGQVRVGVYVDKGTGRSLKSVLSTLGRFEDLSVTKLEANDIRSGKLTGVDVLIQPGGSGSGQGNHLGEAGREAIREYVRDGGGYIGICGGAYLASAHYKWSLNILDAKVLDTKHWARGHGMVEIGITDAGQSLLKTKEPQLAIQYWQGPLLAPANRPEIEDYETIATFETEIAENGAPIGVMLGTTAIAKGKFGNGRVVCFSPHPELTEGLGHLIKHAIDDVKRKTIRVGIYADEGAAKDPKVLRSVLDKYVDVSVRKLNADDIRSGALSVIDVLIQPGGSGGGQGRNLGEEGRDQIRQFVRDGGGFIGICGGAYLASADYEWSLNILDAKVLDRKHWARGKGTVDIGITDAGKTLLNTKKSQLAIRYAQGPLLAPADRPEIEDYEVIAVFDTEVAKNGAPKGVMKGTTAIAKGQYGQGRVVCFSPHPESTEGLKHLVKRAIDHVNRKELTKPQEDRPGTPSTRSTSPTR